MNSPRRKRYALRHVCGAVAIAALFVTCDRANAGCAAAQTTSSGGEVSSSTTRPAARAPLPPAANRFAEIAHTVTPTVVYIESQFSPAAAARLEGGGGGDQQPNLPPGIPPELIPPQFRQRSQAPVHASGSGFIVSSDGYILTNNHVVAGAEKVTVTLVDRRIFQAKVVGHDPTTDVALIKIDGSGFPTAELGNDSTVQVGDPVLAVGNPLALNFTVTAGIISAKERGGLGLAQLFNSNYAVADFLQTDAVINPGNSGGPLVDMQGRVIGINSAIASPTGVYAGYGFAVPISIARIVMDQIRKYGHARHAILGVAIRDVLPNDALAAGLKEIRGALVGDYSSDTSPAKRAGIQRGDVIIALDHHPVDQVSQLERMLLSYQPGQQVTLTVMRYGAQHDVQLTLGEVPAERTVASTDSAGGVAQSPTKRLGIAVSPLTPSLAQQLQLPSDESGMVVMRVDPSGPAAGQLVRGDVITAVLGQPQPQPVRSAADLQRAITGARNGVASLLVYSPQAQQTQVVNIRLGQ